MRALFKTHPRILTTSNSSRKLLLGLAMGLTNCASHTAVVTGPSQRAEAPAPHLLAPVESSDASEPHAPRAALPSPSNDGSVSLEGILAYADEHSPVLRVARATRSRSQAKHVAAAVLFPSNPELTIAAGPRMGADTRGVDLNIALMQKIQISGERGLRQQAADQFEQLTNAEIEELRWSVHCQVHAAFHHTLVELQRAQLASRVVAFQQDVLRVVERQIAAGETAPLTLRLAEAEVAQARQVLVAASQAVLAARIRLAQLTGWPSTVPPMPLGAVDAPREPPALQRLTHVARRSLPALRAASARIDEARARSAVAERQAWPEPSLGVDYSQEANAPSQGGTTHILRGVVSIPIPTFQTNQGPRALAAADVDVAHAELSAVAQLLEGRIAEARSETVAAAARSRAYAAEILPRFEENLTLLRRSFELGEIDILALSSGRERFLQIQSDALTAQLDYFVALAALERVVGVDLWRDDHHQEAPQ